MTDLDLGSMSPNCRPWQRVAGDGGESVVAAVAALPVATALTLIGGWYRWGVAAHDEPRKTCPRPPPVFIAQATGAHQPLDWLGAPDQGAGNGGGVVGLQRAGGDRSNILPLDLHFYF